MSELPISEYTAHLDAFARDSLPPPELWPTFLFERPELRYPERLNCAVEILDRHVDAGRGGRPALVSPAGVWTYAELRDRADRVAEVLADDLDLTPGNRVLLRGFNDPMTVACWLGVVKAGGIVVATMPMLRARELAKIVDRARIGLALCDERLGDEMAKAVAQGSHCRRVCHFGGAGAPGGAELERRMAAKAGRFRPVDTGRDDTVLIAFTSGTTGEPKGTMHFHRDVMAICDAYARSIVAPRPEDVFIGSPPIAFTFGLGGLVAFPLRFGASSVLLEKAGPEELVEAIPRFRASACFTAPTAYRRMVGLASRADLASLRTCVSAGETLPPATWQAWHDATGLRIADGIGSTEMLHIFISSAGPEARPGATGKPVPGYEARVVDADMRPLPAGEVGLLAVRGPTGCRYLADARQREYVREGWNVTGDAYVMDADGYFVFQARADDMIVSSGYKVAGPEVEGVLLAHPAVAECAVVGAPDPERGHAITAFVVPREGVAPGEALAGQLKAFVKEHLATYKCPHVVEFRATLPKTETGKLQRFRLRERPA